ncbi:MAG TPA: glycosyltransferase family 9 protein [Longimicrobiales bacterium]|nr:glycosyltransferase family 9 protein [Longimicrobiales bacterium]
MRAPDHLGDFVIALPAIHAAQPDVVLITRWLAPLAELAGFNTIPVDDTISGVVTAAIQLRRRRLQRGILLTPSLSSALMLRLGGVHSRRGIEKNLIAHQHRAALYMLLATGEPPAGIPKPKLYITRELRSRFRNIVGTGAPLVGVVPGSNAPARRWPAERFAELAKELSVDGRVVVFGSAAEQEQTALVANDVAIDLGGKTDLPMLAAGLAECGMVVTNDTGSLHLAAAVGVPTVSMWGAGNPAETGPGRGHKVLRDSRLPCLECMKHECPRRGPGYILPDAHNECLHLIGVSDVIGAVRNTVTN